MPLRRRVRVGGRKPVEEPEIIVIPMIDVMMFLLFFFMVASLAMAVENAIPVQLPKAATSVQSTQQSIYVTLKPDGQMFLNTSPVTMDQLADKLKALGVSSRNVVTINADEHVLHGSVISVMDEARKAGVVAFGFATNR
jgi:biopolymer transport protein ExbD